MSGWMGQPSDLTSLLTDPRLETLAIPQVAAARSLQDAGIPGIRYLDQGSRGAGEGTHNYVVFNPDTISILRKYGIAGLMGGGAAAAASGRQEDQ